VTSREYSESPVGECSEYPCGESLGVPATSVALVDLCVCQQAPSPPHPLQDSAASARRLTAPLQHATAAL
jgi:hypothetical protein